MHRYSPCRISSPVPTGDAPSIVVGQQACGLRVLNGPRATGQPAAGRWCLGAGQWSRAGVRTHDIADIQPTARPVDIRWPMPNYAHLRPEAHLAAVSHPACVLLTPFTFPRPGPLPASQAAVTCPHPRHAASLQRPDETRLDSTVLDQLSTYEPSPSAHTSSPAAWRCGNAAVPHISGVHEGEARFRR